MAEINDPQSRITNNDNPSERRLLDCSVNHNTPFEREVLLPDYDLGSLETRAQGTKRIAAKMYPKGIVKGSLSGSEPQQDEQK